MAANFSPSARNAARAAIQLAPQSAFHILHAYETPFPVFIRFTNDELMDLQEERLAQIRRDLEDEKRAFLRRDTGTQFPDVQIMLDRDEVDAGIAKAVREIQPDLLTMGMKSFGFAALGRSRTEAYLSGPSCDVLVAA
jgi:nucleotide-binding universal stress UspA family protein